MKKNKVLNVLIALFMVFTINTISFAAGSDIDKHWAKADIVYLMEKGIMEGYSDGTFRPNKNITRAEFIKMVNNIFSLTEKADIAFTDVNEDSWYYEDIEKAVLAGYIGGYEDNTMRPNQPITREEASKIIILVSGLEDELSNSAYIFKDIDQIGEWARNYVGILKDKDYMTGYVDGTFRPKRQITRGETAKILSNVNRNIVEDEPIEEKPIEEISKDKEFIQIVEELPNPNSITEIIAMDKIKVERARQIYNSLTDEEKAIIPDDTINIFEKVESKIQSLKTPIKSNTKAAIAQGQVWAIKKGAHKRFIDAAPFYWQYGELTGINPEMLYVQAAKETNFGRYTGQVKPEMNNWAGIKIYDPIGDDTYDHEKFDTLEDGVRAHFNHMGIYCGVAPIGIPHPRWHKTSTAKWAGTIQYVEDLGGFWAPNPDYGISMVRDYLKNLYNTTLPSEEDMYKAIQLSNKVDEILEDDDMIIIREVIEEYDSLTYSQKDLVPYNIKERIEELKLSK